MRVGMASHLAVVDLIALRFRRRRYRHGAGGDATRWALDQLGWMGFAPIVIGGGAAYTLTVGAALPSRRWRTASAFTQGVLPLTPRSWR